MSLSVSGKLSIGLSYKLFRDNNTFENARVVFLKCREFDQPIPEDVLEVITEGFEIDNADYQKELSAKSEKRFKRLNQRQLLLGLALENYIKVFERSSEATASQDETVLDQTYEDYRQKAKTDDTDEALRKQLERFLKEEMKPGAGAEEAEVKYYNKFKQAKLLKKIELYLIHIRSLV